jgi:urate oxidase
MSNIVLGANQYGKAEVRLVKVTRDTDRHEIQDLNVSSQVRGGQEPAHYEGDNSPVVPTDTQKNTVYAFAKEYGISSIEEFAMLLGKHFTEDFDWITGGRWEVEEFGWNRIPVEGQEHDHAFVRAGDYVRNTVVTVDGDQTWVVSGLNDLTVLKSTGSEFYGFPRDKYTTLQETNDRILATSVTARWRYTSTDLDFNKTFDQIREILLATFAKTHSTALQQTLFQMGSDVLKAVPEVAEVKFSMPNKHHFLVDLEPFGLDNPNEVFFAADRPYGLIEGTVTRDDAPPAGRAWDTVPGFC